MLERMRFLADALLCGFRNDVCELDDWLLMSDAVLGVRTEEPDEGDDEGLER